MEAKTERRASTADQNQSHSVTSQVSGATACLPARLWVWRLAVALVLGRLVGVYQPQQPALLPDGVLSGGALALAVLGSLALDHQIPHKTLVLPSALGLLLGMGMGSLALVGSGLFLPIAAPPRPPPVYRCGGALLPGVPLAPSSGVAVPLADLAALPGAGFVFLLFLFPARVGGLTAMVAAWSVGTVGQQWRAIKTLARWCGAAAWLGIGLHNWIYLQLALPPGPPCPELQDLPDGEDPLSSWCPRAAPFSCSACRWRCKAARWARACD